MGKLTPIERFIAEIPADRRRAYDARQVELGLKRVTVSVPEQYEEWVKVFSRWLRTSSAPEIESMRRNFEESLRCDYEAMDEDFAAGRYTHEDGFVS